jgi:hypothetical protein
MSNRITVVVLSTLVAGVACTPQPIDTSPHPVSITAPPQRYDVEVPPNLEIKSADYSVAILSDVGGNRGSTSSRLEERDLVKIYAVDRTTHEEFLLVYEDVEHRKQPVQIIRLVKGVAPVVPAGTP